MVPRRIREAVGVLAFVLSVLAGCLEAPPDGSGGDPGAPVDAAIAEDLIAWYRMDDGLDDHEASDALGVHPGTCVACPEAGAEGRIGTAYRFAASVIVVPDSSALHLAAGTIAFWLYAEGTGPLEAAVSKPFGPASENSLGIFVLGASSVGFETHANEQLEAPGASISLEDWVHVAGTWDPNGDKRLYLDGAEVARASTFSLEYDGHDLLIGMDMDAGELVLPFLGRLDDLRIYDRPLSDSEVRALAMAP